MSRAATSRRARELRVSLAKAAPTKLAVLRAKATQPALRARKAHSPVSASAQAVAVADGVAAAAVAGVAIAHPADRKACSKAAAKALTGMPTAIESSRITAAAT
jgi:hypothetical protein